MKNKNIFVSLASYNDPLLFFTIDQIFSKADNSNNIRVGIVDQNKSSQMSIIDGNKYRDKIRYLYINIRDTLGVSWARNIAFSLSDNENYLLQIDSHTVLEQGWDTVMINQHEALLKVCPKPIITAYPHPFNMENGIPIYAPAYKDSVPVLRPLPNEKLTDRNAQLGFTGKNIRSVTPILGCHIAGGYYFCSSQLIQEVPYDPFLYFSGEEQSLAIRAYTRGWDIYHPSYMPIYHQYKQAGVAYETHHWDQQASKNRAFTTSHLMTRSGERLIKLFYTNELNDTIYGLGNIRGIDDYILMSGINYKTKKITDPYSTRY